MVGFVGIFGCIYADERGVRHVLEVWLLLCVVLRCESEERGKGSKWIVRIIVD